MNCDNCKYYEYDHCRKWDCEVDVREVRNCFEAYDTPIRDKMVNYEDLDLIKENMMRLHNWCAMHGIIYVQWYPYDNCSGYYIENPSEDALEKFYENVNASDPHHRSFVLILGQTETHNNLNMRTIDEYIQHYILPFLFC